MLWPKSLPGRSTLILFDRTVRTLSKATRALLDHELAKSCGNPFNADVIMRIANRFYELGWKGGVVDE